VTQVNTDWSRFGFFRIATVAPPVHIADPAANALEIAAWATKADAAGASLVVFPELSLTGYTCEDLFLSSDLLDRSDAALVSLANATASLEATLVVGVPLRTSDGRRYNTAVVLQGGNVHGAVPKQHLPNNGEFYERRWFTPGTSARQNGFGEPVHVAGLEPFDLVLRTVFSVGGVGVGIEICEDLWAPDPPSTALALGGALVIVNPSASNELVAKAEYRRQLVGQQSARTHTAYAYAGAGPTESTKDIVFGGHCLIVENGALLTETERFVLAGAMTIADVDVEKLANERSRNITWSTALDEFMRPVESVLVAELRRSLPTLEREFPTDPFVPDDPITVHERAREILAIQSTGLARRMMAARSERLVIGVSGGLDSTLALLVAVEACRRLDKPPSTILGITMPGPGTTGRTRSAATDLMTRLGIDQRTIPIGPAVALHLTDIGHGADVHDVTYENAQARERTQILFDIANQVKGIVVGTGDLSELALGWCTYNADHMANYGVNASVPKTLVRHLVRWYANQMAAPDVADVLVEVLDTPVSPELLPPDADGKIVQFTEDTIGPYELHDFFLWHWLRNGFSGPKVRALAMHAFAGERGGTYDDATITKWLTVFLERFHRQQFKRTTLPPSPKVGSVSVSPRGDLRMPDEADPAASVRHMLGA
jgi:NAD+ synthase (glutamine-hydrolysing)